MTACSNGPRDAAAVSTSFSGAVVTPDSTDLGSIVIGWGQGHSATAITSPRPEDVAALRSWPKTTTPLPTECATG